MIDAIREFFDTYLQGSWTSIIDILLVAFVIYWLFILIRGTRAVRIVIGLSILYLVYLAARLLDLQLLTQLMETAAVVGLFAVVVVFQPELRRALEQIGRFGASTASSSVPRWPSAERVAREISRAARILAGSRHGALIALERETGLQDLATESGVPIHADLRAELLGHDLLPRDGAPRRRGRHQRRADHGGGRPPADEPDGPRLGALRDTASSRHRHQRADRRDRRRRQRGDRLDQPRHPRPHRAEPDRGPAPPRGSSTSSGRRPRGGRSRSCDDRTTDAGISGEPTTRTPPDRSIPMRGSSRPRRTVADRWASSCATGT